MASTFLIVVVLPSVIIGGIIWLIRRAERPAEGSLRTWAAGLMGLIGGAAVLPIWAGFSQTVGDTGVIVGITLSLCVWEGAAMSQTTSKFAGALAVALGGTIGLCSAYAVQVNAGKLSLGLLSVYTVVALVGILLALGIGGVRAFLHDRRTGHAPGDSPQE